MAFHKGRFGLFFSLPLDAQDWANLDASRVRLVMLMLEHATTDTLRALADRGCKVVLRVNEADYYSADAPLQIATRVMMARRDCPVDAVIVGNEPDHPFNMNYGSVGWGQEFAYVHRMRFSAVRRILQNTGARVVSPAPIMRSISEDDPPAPGRVTWREIMCLSEDEGYQLADFNGCHLYAYGWDGPVDELRLKFALKQQTELWHKPLYVDEVGVSGNHTPIEKMRAYIDIAEILMSIRDGRQLMIGQRVEFLCPFVSNGSPDGSWDARYLLRDPACYRLLGDWMAV